MTPRTVAVAGLLLLSLGPLPLLGASGSAVQARLSADLAAGKPVVVHLLVALCDNEHQGIVPVPEHLGNGQQPTTNLYWGALYGVPTHFTREAGWERLDSEAPGDPRILDRAVLYAESERDGWPAPVYVVADAVDGAEIRPALETFLRMAAGESPVKVKVQLASGRLELQAGGAAHIVAFVGHNGLMDFSLVDSQGSLRTAPARSAVVLACASKPYFLQRLQAAGAHALLLTTGFMAPEAYTLDAVIRSWVAGAESSDAREAAASAYHAYQKCGLGGARKLFWSEE